MTGIDAAATITQFGAATVREWRLPVSESGVYFVQRGYELKKIKSEQLYTSHTDSVLVLLSGVCKHRRLGSSLAVPASSA